MTFRYAALPLAILILLPACNGAEPPANTSPAEAAEADHDEEGVVTLTARQIATAGIELTHPVIGGSGGAIELPATIEGDADAIRVVAAPISGRVIALNRNLGDAVRRGETLAILESREAASLHAEVEKARTRLDLARATLARDEALYKRGFRPLREVEISRAGFAEAETNLQLARQQASASGARGGGLNRIAVTAPIAGRVIARRATLGQMFMADAADTELFRIADTSRLSVALSLSSADAARIPPGTPVEIVAGGRRGNAKIRFVSPALDAETRQVPAIAMLDTRAGQWRVGETVTATVRLAADGDAAIRVPSTAVQTVEGKTVVFVRTESGFRAVPVTLGRQDGAMVVVTGLTGREQIAAANSFTLKSALGATEEHGH
ncbi:efflux RND transporter periplasmic adaptor subunit [Sphingomonas sp. G-3-2-10]|uniref:efflux RND transporter periplasmic adaptor subunit n=1 Tax=Sphingomonas sp. G-3-2-10 TaxID=2728838 RepID=UPI00146ACC72|nr:efflux RND transporter periplasmic adaptor subunit [Sphingomonas sp. G-3-2-10]NML04335.1 efflux RND transporter periplasmic adaptor subunit [Sphingomonas sp. G-3-2-10]